MRLEVEGLARAYGGQPAVDGLTFALAAGEIGCLLGPSGCGKTTALRCIAGFERPDAGRIVAGGEVLAAPGAFVPPEQRRIGMVFQDYALFPHLDVLGNVAFGLRGLDRGARLARAREVLALVGLGELVGRYPDELSGGQQQRVALARALAPRPRLVLLDEPFSSLDAEVRRRLAADVRAALKLEGATALLVTHDQQEAFAIADRVGVMRAGRLEQWDSAWRLYHSPATRFVADFVGDGAFIPGSVEGEQRVATELGPVEGELTAPLPAGASVDLLLRPDDIVVDAASPLRTRILDKCFRGAQFMYTLALPSGERVLALVPSHEDHRVGGELGIRLETRHLVGFPRDT
jgi:iron(III) transport system ATP-binding protein